MDANLFLDFIFQNISEYLFYVLVFSILLHFVVRRYAVNILDPIYFYFVFSFSTSYAIVFLLWMHEELGNYYFIIVFLYFFIYWLSFYIFYELFLRYRIYNINYLVIKDSESGLFILLMFIFYFLAALYFVSQIDFSSFKQSRFEANRGFGIFVRYMDFSRILLSSFLFIKLINSKGSRRFLFLFIWLLFLLISSSVNGAKASMIESLLAGFVAYYCFSGKKISINFKNSLYFFSISILVMYFVLKIIGNYANETGYFYTKYLDIPVEWELFLLRIIANGDMYYLSLPNGVIDGLFQGNGFYQAFGYILGNGLMDAFFSYKYSDNNLGRLIWLYWVPDEEIYKGTANHFDLEAYSYFGFFGGMFFTLFNAFLVSWICAFKKNSGRGQVVFSCFLACLYTRSLQIFLSPSVGIAYILDAIFIYLLFFIFIKIIRGRIQI